MVEDGHLVVWFIGQEGSAQPFSDVKCLTQTTYHSSLAGIKGVKALIEFHKNFEDFAKAQGYNVIVSSSYLPSKATFNRVLVREGWSEAPFGMVKNLIRQT